ncbi:stage II sporulation protein E [Fuchsiella alkaliacetigena]|uniref:stage II sporulation protein E n=1 Tax=Fuchsiella alkaliacetigena TaxID=957042 RepID=UPI00200A4808|nr:stage II sporulation protein E [Fuchsiella alkaliacetigena]MCK8824900.1 stage II sporulation protein E [Fuchsiella alkaliacetigena]
MIESDLSSYQRMKEKAGKLLRLKNRFKELILGIDVLHIVYTIVGLIIGRAFLSSELLPFGLSFIALILYQYLCRSEKLSRVVLFVFSIYLGYYNILGFSWSLGKYFLSGLIFASLAIYFFEYKEGISKLKFSILNGGVLLMIEVIGLVLAARFLHEDLLSLLGAILVMILTFILVKGLSPLFYVEHKDSLADINILALLTTLAVLNIGLPNIEVGVINLPRVFSSLVVMLIALLGGGAVATVAGAVIGLVYSISNLYVVEVTGLYALAGLIGGHFNREGKLGVIVGFFLTALMYTVLLVEINDINAILAESLLAGGVLLLIPAFAIDSLGFLVPDLVISAQTEQRNKLSQQVIQKVNRVRGVFMEIVDTFEKQPTAKQGRAENSSLDELLNIVANQVCLKCELYNICWEQKFFETYQSCLEILSRAEKKGQIKARRLNEIMEGDCKFPRKLSEKVNRFLEKYEINNFWHKKLKDSQEIISNQVIGLVELLEKLATDLEVEINLDNNLKKVVQSELEAYGIFIEELTVLEKEQEEMEFILNKRTCAGEKECTSKVLPTLNKILKQKFRIKWSKCGASLGEENCLLKIASAVKYQVQVGVAQTSPEQEEVSGDDYKVVNVNNKEEVAILSDGMGIGKRAALESQSAVDLLEKLIATGFDKELAIKIVNSALLLRSSEEVFATVDISAIDRYTGQADFIKIGSAPTFIKRNNREIEVIKGTSLPIGIIDNIDIKLNRQLSLEAGNMVVMLTDGVIDSQWGEVKQETWMKRLLKNCLINDPQSLADYILEQALDSKTEINDDMTVLTIKLTAYPQKSLD